MKEFPNNEALDTLFPDRPVLLTRIDGHAAVANQKALDLAGVKAGDTLTGGEVEDARDRRMHHAPARSQCTTCARRYVVE